MVKKKGGIPKEVLEDLDIKKKTKKKKSFINAIVEEHQVRLTVPKKISLNIKIKKGQKFEVTYNKKEKKITYQLK